MRTFRTSLLLIFSFLFTGTSLDCLGQRKVTNHPESYKRRGIASFYSNRFEGRLTATGEHFHQHKKTAASNTLPLDTYVKVTNLKNGYWTVVRINDRMNRHNRRLIDLSKSAAREIHFRSGLKKVSVEYVPRKEFYPFLGLSFGEVIRLATM